MSKKAEPPDIQAKPLFRKEVLENTPTQAFGPLLMTFPLSYECIGWLITFLLGMFIIWSLSVNFQEKTTVQGYLDVKPGLVKIFPQATGIIIKNMVHEGQLVKRGDQLFKIRTSFDGIHKQRITALRMKRAQLIADIKKEQAQLIRYHNLVEHHFLSQYDYDQHVKKMRLIEQASTQMKINILQAKLAQTFVVKAPIAGTVSQVETHLGQFVSGNNTLLTIRPNTARWVGYLLIPMQAIRFVTLSQGVKLHYDAYPFNQFGSVNGKIVTWPSVLSNVPNAGNMPMKAPFYQIEVGLPEPYLHWHGKQLPLFQGMSLKAILTGRKQRLWAWLRHIL